MAKQYYTLVAGLREYSFDTDTKGFDAPAIIAEVREELSGKDLEYLELFYTYYDIENIINILSGRSRFSQLGNFSREELEKESGSPEQLPKYLADILQAYRDLSDPEYDEIDRTKSLEKALFTAYYNRCEKSKCRFIRQWYEFDRNLRNVIAAFNARRLDIPVAEELVGEGYITETLAKSSGIDFGLKGELEYIDRIIAAVGEEGNFVEKERIIDLLRWEMAEEFTTFDYFNINTILGYLARVNIIYRWVALDPAVGREMLRMLMESMSREKLLNETLMEKERKIY